MTRTTTPRHNFDATLRWFLATRAFSALALLTLMLVLQVVHQTRSDLHIPIVLCLVELVANAVWAGWLRTGQRLHLLVNAQFMTDVACIWAGIIATGGLASPFLPLYVIVVLSAGLLSMRYAVVYASLCSFAVVSLVAAPRTGIPSPFQHDAFLIGGVLLCNVTVLMLTSIVVSFFRARTQAEQTKLRDVTDVLQHAYDELMAYERQQRELNQNLQKSMQARSEFLALMSHELRTPLNSVIGFADLMLEPSVTVNDEERRNFLEHIRKGGKHLLSIIDNIIDLSRVGVGTLQMRLEPVDVCRLVDDACDSMKRTAAERSVTLAHHTEGTLPQVMGEPRRVRQILGQLLDNALRFTPAGGRVTVTVRPHEAGVMVSVADTGEGIPHEHLDKVFEPFHQVDSSIRRQHGGTGLGLALVRTFVEVMGGRIWVESTLGEGTTMTFTLPTSPPQPQASSPPPAPPLP